MAPIFAIDTRGTARLAICMGPWALNQGDGGRCCRLSPARRASSSSYSRAILEK
jgi:hypothetical protein